MMQAKPKCTMCGETNNIYLRIDNIEKFDVRVNPSRPHRTNVPGIQFIKCGSGLLVKDAGMERCFVFEKTMCQNRSSNMTIVGLSTNFVWVWVCGKCHYRLTHYDKSKFLNMKEYRIPYRRRV
jgi:ribosomal protein S27AE